MSALMCLSIELKNMKCGLGSLHVSSGLGPDVVVVFTSLCGSMLGASCM